MSTRTPQGYNSPTNNILSSSVREFIAGAAETLTPTQVPGDKLVGLGASDASGSVTLTLLDPGAKNAPEELEVIVSDVTGTVRLQGATDDTAIILDGNTTIESNTNPVTLSAVGNYLIKFLNVSDIDPNAGRYIVIG